jgi:hypothetical protein
MNMAANTGNIRDDKCGTCGHVGYSHFYDREGSLAECHESACKCLHYTVMSSSLDQEEDTGHFHDMVPYRIGGADTGGSPLALASVPAARVEMTKIVELAITFAKIVHDAQDEQGLETRHDIGLVVLDKLTELGEVTSWCSVHEHVPAMISDEREYSCRVSTMLMVPIKDSE